MKMEKYIDVRISQLKEDLAKAHDPMDQAWYCLLYTSPSPRDLSTSRMPSSA